MKKYVVRLIASGEEKKVIYDPESSAPNVYYGIDLDSMSRSEYTMCIGDYDYARSVNTDGDIFEDTKYLRTLSFRSLNSSFLGSADIDPRDLLFSNRYPRNIMYSWINDVTSIAPRITIRRNISVSPDRLTSIIRTGILPVPDTPMENQWSDEGVSVASHIRRINYYRSTRRLREYINSCYMSTRPYDKERTIIQMDCPTKDESFSESIIYRAAKAFENSVDIPIEERSIVVVVAEVELPND